MPATGKAPWARRRTPGLMERAGFRRMLPSSESEHLVENWLPQVRRLAYENGTLSVTRFVGGAVLRAAPVFTLVLTGCQPAVLDPAGPVGAAEKTILIDSLAIMLAIVVPTILATLAFALWFRRSNARARRLPEWAHSGRIELIVWAVPMLTITLLGGVAWIGSHQLDPAVPIASDTPTIEVQGVSLDWKWLFIYPRQHVASVNRLVIPAGTPIHFSLTSGSVMNAFFVPRLGSMIYTMNGMTSQLNLRADEPGEFEGLSSHYSGDGFSDMRFSVQAVTQQGFAAWVGAARGSGPTLDDAGYAALARQGVQAAPSTYRDADPGLFERIATQRLPPAAGPAPSASPKPLKEVQDAG